MSSERELRRYAPFDESWEKGWQTLNGEAFAQIHEIKDNPNWLAKSFKVRDVAGQIGSEHQVKSLDEFIKEFQKVDEYSKKYFADFLPKYYFTFTGKSSEDLSSLECYQFMQRVFPAEMSDAAIHKVVNDLNRIYEQAKQGYQDTKHTENGIELGEFIDIKPANIIYGTVSDNPEPKTYLIDIFPLREGPAPELDLIYLKTLRDIQTINKDILK